MKIKVTESVESLLIFEQWSVKTDAIFIQQNLPWRFLCTKWREECEVTSFFNGYKLGVVCVESFRNYPLLYAYLLFSLSSVILTWNKYCYIYALYVIPDKELPTLYPNISTLVLRVWSGLNVLQWQKNTRWIWKRTAWNISTVCTWGKLNYEKSGHCDHNAKIKLRNHWRPTYGLSSTLSISWQTCISRWKLFLQCNRTM